MSYYLGFRRIKKKKEKGSSYSQNVCVRVCDEARLIHLWEEAKEECVRVTLRGTTHHLSPVSDAAVRHGWKWDGDTVA